MRYVIGYAVSLFLTLLAGISFLKLRAYQAGQALDQKIQSASTGSTSKEDLLLQAKQASSLWFAPEENHVRYARLLKELADSQKDTSIKMLNYCEMLTNLGKALQQSPLNSRYLVSWASTRQLLGNYNCEHEFSNGGFREAIQLAVTTDPTNTAVLFAAALVEIWGGDRSQGLKYLSSVLTYSAGRNETRERFVFAQIRSIEDLKLTIPGRFPQVYQWSAKYYNQAYPKFLLFCEAFEQLQSNAIEESEQALKAGRISGKLHYERLTSLVPYAASQSLRQKIDRQLAELLEHAEFVQMLPDRRKRQRDYYRERSNYSALAVVKSVLALDTRPQRGSLAHWNRNATVLFDDYHTSVGFYVAPEGGVRLIELHAGKRFDPAILQQIAVFVSNDNEHWQEVTAQARIEALKIGEEYALAIRLEPLRFSYWKVHYNGSGRTHTFVNSVKKMIYVYGYGS